MLSISIDPSVVIVVKTHIVCFMIGAFQSLDNGLIRKECAALVSISLWHHLGSEAAREREFKNRTVLKKAWRASKKRYDNAEKESQHKLRFDRDWLYAMTIDFISRIGSKVQGTVPTKVYVKRSHVADQIIYCERFLELLTGLISQLPTRRYVNTLLKSLNLLALLRLSSIFNDAQNVLFADLVILFRHFVNFPIDDQVGSQRSSAEAYEEHCGRLARLQRTALKEFKEKLTLLALTNFALLEKREELEGFLNPLTDNELSHFCQLLDLRSTYPSAANVSQTRALYCEIIVSSFERTKSFEDTVKNLSLMPTETTLYEESLLRNETFDGSRPLAIPKFNLQYLSVGDFLWRAYVLYRCESFFEVRKDMEETIERLQPRTSSMGIGTQFGGFSKMAIPISRPAIIEVASPNVGSQHPSFVRAEIALDTGRLAERLRLEWSALRPGDVVYLLSVNPKERSTKRANGHFNNKVNSETSMLQVLRTAEIVQLQDTNGSILREHQPDQYEEPARRQRLGRLIVNIDSTAYRKDYEQKAAGKPDVYDSINLIVRRKGRENNFSKILQTIRTLTTVNTPVPSWLRDVFLGFGDPAGAHYTRLEGRLRKVDFRDTFLDWTHLKEGLPGKSLEIAEPAESGDLGPPFMLETLSLTTAESENQPSKKRKRDEPKVNGDSIETIKVHAYQPPNTGPYPADAPKVNQVRFTPAQIEAIASGTQPGLTVIVGPPGTGKTDVATQIMSNIYHGFPAQRTVLITHSNQALNQLFQKITKLDIDQRHLLRLGHGEDALETDTSYGKYGRVESFLDNRAFYLAEVDRLAANLNAPGAHGNSCETAGYFDSVYVGPAWSKFWLFAKDPEVSSTDIVAAFPFHQYFSNAPQPIFPPASSKDTILDIATGCERHISKVFTELADIRPFEILRTPRDKSNYLMIKEARIIAMTSTHAAMHRQEYVDLGFKYDNVVIEEAAQITEIESFIPFVLQNPPTTSSNNDNATRDMPLKRAILLGDHLQNSPVVQNAAFRQFANLEQSLFQRFVRLGVPTINLDTQGRARPSLADIYAWRYEKLTHLPHVLSAPEFLLANPGFRYEYQFIHVPDYQSQGETQPSPHFFQNLGEAEYAVAIYQYMRLLGYPAHKISILATYAGQRSLIRDILLHRCSKRRLFGMPRIVATVDKYQGEQNDYIILSLTRTARPGFLRSIRRMTVAFSRARLGLYVLGRREVLEQCPELGQFVKRLRPEGRYPSVPVQKEEDGGKVSHDEERQEERDTLSLVTKELFGPHLENPDTARKVGDEVEAVQMVSVEHLGQYVFEMTKARVDALQREGESVPIGHANSMDIDTVGGDENENTAADAEAKGAPEEDDEREEEGMEGIE